MNKLVKFVKESRNELKRVEWPSFKETMRLTGYVIGVSFVVSIFVMLLDYGFKELLTLVLAR